MGDKSAVRGHGCWSLGWAIGSHLSFCYIRVFRERTLIASPVPEATVLDLQISSTLNKAS